MQVNFLIEIEDLDGQPIPTVDNDGKPTNKNVTLKSISVNALQNITQEDAKMTGEEKVKRFTLAEKIYKADAPIDVSAKDVVTLKELIGKMYAPLIVARAWEILEPAPKEAAK